MKRLKLTLLCTAMAAAFAPAAQAQSNAELLEELKALKARIADLEKKVAEQPAKPAEGQWGMTPQQQQDFNRIAVKTEALEDNMEAMGLKGLKISGYMDPTYIYNQRQQRSGFQFLNKYEDDLYNYDNSYFGSASIDFLKETDGGARWHLTLTPNRGVGAVFDKNSIVQEASVSVPLTSLTTRLIAGQIPDWSGYEYQQPTLNKLITHNLLYDFTLPTAYVGAGTELTRDKWVIKAMLAQVNATKNPVGEKGSALVYRGDYSMSEFSGIGFAGLHGKLANFNGGKNTAANLFEVDTYMTRGDLTLQGQLSYGQQEKAAITPDPITGEFRKAQWYGFSVLGAYKFQPRLEGIARFDYLYNKKNGGGLLGFNVADARNGIGPDATLGCGADPTIDGCSDGVNRMALSLGLGYAFNANTTFKVEYRIDNANKAVFGTDYADDGSGTLVPGSYKKTNQLLGASVVVFF